MQFVLDGVPELVPHPEQGLAFRAALDHRIEQPQRSITGLDKQPAVFGQEDLARGSDMVGGLLHARSPEDHLCPPVVAVSPGVRVRDSPNKPLNGFGRLAKVDVTVGGGPPGSVRGPLGRLDPFGAHRSGPLGLVEFTEGIAKVLGDHFIDVAGVAARWNRKPLLAEDRPGVHTDVHSKQRNGRPVTTLQDCPWNRGATSTFRQRGGVAAYDGAGRHRQQLNQLR